MSPSEIQNRIRVSIKKAGYSLSEDRALLEQIDSLQVVHLLDLLETEFDIEIESFEVQPDHFSSIENLSHFILKKMSKS